MVRVQRKAEEVQRHHAAGLPTRTLIPRIAPETHRVACMQACIMHDGRDHAVGHRPTDVPAEYLWFICWAWLRALSTCPRERLVSEKRRV